MMNPNVRNAVEMISFLKKRIETELKHAHNVCLIGDSILTGSFFINDERGEKPDLAITERRINDYFIDISKIYLGYNLIDHLASPLLKLLRHSADTSCLVILEEKKQAEPITAEYFINCMEQLLEINKSYFERLLAYAMMSYVLGDICGDDRDIESIKQTSTDIVFGKFYLPMHSSLPNSVFPGNRQNILSAVILINSICGVTLSPSNLSETIDQIMELDPYTPGFESRMILGIQITVLKSGFFQVTLDEAQERWISLKVKPYLDSYNDLFIDVDKKLIDIRISSDCCAKSTPL